jgi:23S rRNA pseudouridine1911/1915/1917 synthase
MIPNNDLDPQDVNDEEELYEIKKLIVDPGQEATRIDKFIVNHVINATRNKVQQSIDQGLVLVNGQPIKANYKTRPNDEIVIYSDNQPRLNEIIPQNIPLNILFEDDDIIILNKPVGLVVHPGSGNFEGTLLNGIAYYLKQQNPTVDDSNLARYGLVHRIDKNTSGIMVVAKTEFAIQHLSKQFFHHTIKRRYVALVWGNIEEDEGTIEAHVGRSTRDRKVFAAFPDGEFGKHAITHYKVLERLGYVTLVQCILETGRTHQIRVHMKHIGHPLFNDATYGGDKIVKGTVFTRYKQFVDNCFKICNRQALHAKFLGFVHPTTNEEVAFDSDLADDMQKLIAKWKAYSPNKQVDDE